MELIPRSRLFLTVAAYAGLVTMAFAQPPGGGRGGPPGGPRGGGGIGGLLRSDEVREELELMDDQVEQLRELEEAMREEMRGKMRERFRGERGEGGERRGRPDREEMRAMFDEFRKEAEGRVEEVLTTQQMDRLKQINLQQQVNRGGARALMGGPLSEALDLSDDQKEQLQERAKEVRAEMEKKIQAARDEANAQLMEILSSEQKAKLQEMTGEPFAMSRPEGPRGPRGGADGGNRRAGRPGPPERAGRGGRGKGKDGKGGKKGRPGPPPRD